MTIATILQKRQPEQRHHLIFQQDGAPPHHSCEVRARLNTNYSNCIDCRGGAVPWPARSPGLNPIDFCVCGVVIKN